MPGCPVGREVVLNRGLVLVLRYKTSYSEAEASISIVKVLLALGRFCS